MPANNPSFLINTDNPALDRGRRLRILRGMLGLTIQKFSGVCELGESTIRLWEQGRGSGLSYKGAARIVKSLENSNIDCGSDWLLSGQGTPPRFRRPVIVVDDLMESTDEYASEELTHINEEIHLFYQISEHTKIYTQLDSSMLPIYGRGDRLGSIQYYGADIAKCIGEICVIQPKERAMLLRKLELGDEPDRYNLIALNEESLAPDASLYNIKLVSVGPVIRMWRLPKAI